MRRISLLFAACTLIACSGSSIDDGDPLAHGGSGGEATNNANGGAATGGVATGGSLNGGATAGGAANGGMSTGMGGGIGNGGSANNAGAPGGGATSSNGGTGGTSSGSGGKGNSAGANGGGATSKGGASSSGGAASGGATSGGAAASGGAAQAGSTGTAGGSHTNPLTQAQIDAFVNAHNQARSGNLNPPPSPALPPVTWDATLADVAFNYLSKCQGTTLSDHNANRTKDYAALGGKDYVGENIYASSGKSADPAAAVSSWMSEASSFDYNNPNLSAAGHYTQVVWRASVRIGCAIVNCPNMKYPNNILCDYAPGGNISGQKPY